MRRTFTHLLVALTLVTVMTAGLATTGATAKAAEFRALVYTRTTDFRHESIATGIATVKRLGARHDFAVKATESQSAFRARNLRRFDVVIFLNTTGNVLGPGRQTAFKRYIRNGGGFVGIHSAADTEHGWPFYLKLLGAEFSNHPAQAQATIHVEDSEHPSTRHLDPTWVRFDEWYNFVSNPRGTAHVLATIDESTYSGGDMGSDHPIAWCQRFQGGRSWYTNSGHRIDTYAEPDYRRHILGGIRWAAGDVKGDCSVGGATSVREQLVAAPLILGIVKLAALMHRVQAL